MNRILAKKLVSPTIVKFEISTSIAVSGIQPGQYVILKKVSNPVGFPLPVLKTNPEKGSVTLMVQITDKSAAHWAELEPGNTDFFLEGPFGNPSKIEKFGTVLCIGRGSGILPLLPVVTALRGAGNQVISILSTPSGDEMILHLEISALSDQIITISDDGSFGEKASICKVLGQTLKNNQVNQVIVIGSAQVIKETCSLTTKTNIPTQAVLYSRNPVANGIHGIFRVSILGNVRSVCVDGFNFNAWYPNFDEMIKRFGGTEEETQEKMNVSSLFV